MVVTKRRFRNKNLFRLSSLIAALFIYLLSIYLFLTLTLSNFIETEDTEREESELLEEEKVKMSRYSTD